MRIINYTVNSNSKIISFSTSRGNYDRITLALAAMHGLLGVEGPSTTAHPDDVNEGQSPQQMNMPDDSSQGGVLSNTAAYFLQLLFWKARMVHYVLVLLIAWVMIIG